MNPSTMKKHLLMLHRLYFKTLSIYGERVTSKEAEKVKELQGILQYVQTKCSPLFTIVKTISSKNIPSKKKSSTVSLAEEASLGKRSPVPSLMLENDHILGDDAFAGIPRVPEPAQKRFSTFDTFEETLTSSELVPHHYMTGSRLRTDSGQGRDLIGIMSDLPTEDFFGMSLFATETPPQIPNPSRSDAYEDLRCPSLNNQEVQEFSLQDETDGESSLMLDKLSELSTADVSHAPLSFGILVSRPMYREYRNSKTWLKLRKFDHVADDPAKLKQLDKVLALYSLRRAEQDSDNEEQSQLICFSPEALDDNQFFSTEPVETLSSRELQEELKSKWLPEAFLALEFGSVPDLDLSMERLIRSHFESPTPPPPPPPQPEREEMRIETPPKPAPRSVEPDTDHDDTMSRSSRMSGRSRGCYHMLPLNDRMKIVNYSLSHGIDDTCKKFNLSRSRVKRYIKNGVIRKTGGGRKTLDPNMEEKLLNWIEDSARETGVFPAKVLIKNKAVDLTTVANFRGSKGWCDKFLKRNQPRLDVIKEMYVHLNIK